LILRPVSGHALKVKSNLIMSESSGAHAALRQDAEVLLGVGFLVACRRLKEGGGDEGLFLQRLEVRSKPHRMLHRHDLQVLLLTLR